MLTANEARETANCVKNSLNLDERIVLNTLLQSVKVAAQRGLVKTEVREYLTKKVESKLTQLGYRIIVNSQNSIEIWW